MCSSYKIHSNLDDSESRSVVSLCIPIDYTVHGILQARILEWVTFPFSRDLPNLEIEPRSLTLQSESLPAEPQGKPKNTGLGSLSLPQWIFLTQGSKQSLLHCRWILYLLSYMGSPVSLIVYTKKFSESLHKHHYIY